MKKFFGFGSSTPPPPPPPSKAPLTPTPPVAPAKTPAASSPPAGGGGTASIVGKWKEPGGSDTTEFHADGTVTERAAAGETIRGRYSVDGGKLKINLDGVPNEILLTATVTGNALETRDSDGQVTRYARA